MLEDLGHSKDALATSVALPRSPKASSRRSALPRAVALWLHATTRWTEWDHEGIALLHFSCIFGKHPNQSNIMDISRLVESQDSEPPAHRCYSAPNSSPAHSYAIAPATYCVSSVPPTPTLLAGGLVEPLTQPPPVPSFQTGSPSPRALPPIYQPKQSSYHSAQLYYRPSLSAEHHAVRQSHPVYTTIPPIGSRSGPPATQLRSVSVLQKRGAPSSAADAASSPEKKGKWTQEENQIAIELRRTGMKWDDIAKRLPGRSAISCRLARSVKIGTRGRRTSWLGFTIGTWLRRLIKNKLCS